MLGGNAADTVKSKVYTPFIPGYLPTTTDNALEAYDTVLKNVGCTIPVRDTLDQRIINDVRNRTGKFIDVQGGYPHGTPYAQTVNAWLTWQLQHHQLIQTMTECRILGKMQIR
jgi:hypothetical protein